MKSVLVAIIFLRVLAQGSALAQPVLTVENSLPTLGESFIELIGPPLEAGAAGAEQTWDFSAFQPTDTAAFSFSTAVTDSFGGCPLHCSYDLIGGDYTVRNDYYPWISVAPWFGYVGTLPWYLSCSRMLVLPFSFGTTYDSQHVYQVNFGNCDDGSFDELSIADGYGTVILPFGTYGPVLRVHTITEFIALDAPDLDAYRFYLPGTHHPLVTIAQGFPVPFDTTWTMRMLDQISIVGISEDPLIRGGLILRPQPVQDMLFVQVPDDHHTPAQVMIQDISGRLAHQYDPMDLVDGLDVSGLSPGVYVLCVTRKGSPALSNLFIKSDH